MLLRVIANLSRSRACRTQNFSSKYYTSPSFSTNQACLRFVSVPARCLVAEYSRVITSSCVAWFLTLAAVFALGGNCDFVAYLWQSEDTISGKAAKGIGLWEQMSKEKARKEEEERKKRLERGSVAAKPV